MLMRFEMRHSYEKLVKKYLHLLEDVERVYIFGSSVDLYKMPNDIDILILYSEYSKIIQQQIDEFKRQLEGESKLPVDLTILSYEEEQQIDFLGKVSSIQLK